MKNKRTINIPGIALLTAALLITLCSLASCGGNKTDAPPSDTSPDITDAASTPEETPADSTTAEVSENSGKEGETTGKADASTTKTKLELKTIKLDPDAPSDLPALYINLDDGVKQDSISHDEYTTAVLALDGKGYCENVSETLMRIKGRGNYSWSFPKKPYNIKFDEKTDLGEMGAAKKWTLVTTYSDKTMLRNYITLKLAKDVGMECGADCIRVNLYVNGDFRGLYLLTERVQIQKNRINIDKETGRLFEIEMQYRHSDCSNCIITDNGVHIMLKEPESDDVGREEINEILKKSKTLINSAEKAMTGPAARYNKFIDAESFAQWYIINEICKNYDSIFVTSCYCYINDEGKLAMGSPWDYDTCYGNQVAATCVTPTGWYIADATWYKLLFQSEDFNKYLAAKWDELKAAGVFDKMTENIEAFARDYGESIEANNERWPNTLKESGLRGGMSLFTYDEEVEYLKNWLATRLAWLDEAITDDGINRNAVAVTEYDTKKYKDTETKKLIEQYDKLTKLVEIDSVESNITGNTNEYVENLFDLNETTKYCWTSKNKTTVTFKTTEPVAVHAYALKTANDTYEYDTRNPNGWTLSGSMDGKKWTVLASEPNGDSRMTTENYTYNVFTTSNDGEYQYFKFEIKDNDTVQLSELTLLGNID